jgi:hypothetical protein
MRTGASCRGVSDVPAAAARVADGAAWEYPGDNRRSEVHGAVRGREHVVAEAESTERRPRRRVVEEILRGEPHPRYRICWDDARQTVYTPVAGALRKAAAPTAA